MEKVNDDLTMAVRSDSLTSWMKLARILPSRWQARERFEVEALVDLAVSIKRHGLINPVLVYEVLPERRGYYELVAGERRVRASVALVMKDMFPQHSLEDWVARLADVGLLGLGAEEQRALEQSNAAIPAQIRWPADEHELQALHLVAVLENIEHADLSPIEEARGFQALADEYGWTQRELASALGKSQSYVAQRLSLLGLTPAAEEALSTRVLNTSHARAIARVPEALQPAVTEWAIEAVQRDDSPATTRQVDKMARAVAAFVDPARWEPNEGATYTPAQRNRLAVIRAAVEGVDLAKRADALMKLERWKPGYNPTNVLTVSPRTVINDPQMVDAVLAALDSSAWALVMVDLGRTCEHCLFFPHVDEIPLTEQTLAYPAFHCRRQKDRNVMTCSGYIGPDDPVVIPLPYRVQDWLEGNRPEAKYKDQTLDWIMTSVADYIDAYRQTIATMEARAAARGAAAAERFKTAIAAYQAWQAKQPAEVLEHFQAHACRKCAAHLAQAPGCFYGIDPLRETYGDRNPRPPEMIAYVMSDGRVLPRCEGFSYQELPELAPTAVEFENRKVAAEWLKAISRVNVHWRGLRTGMWGVLRWVDYGAGRSNDLNKLASYVVREWDGIGGSRTVATLLRAAVHEVYTIEERNQTGVQLWNPATAEVEEFAVLEPFDILVDEPGAHSYSWIRENWPEGFPWPLPELEDGEDEEDAGAGDPDNLAADPVADQ